MAAWVICPQSAINLLYNEKEGLFIPDIDIEKCINCGLCLKCCPATKETSNSLIGDYCSSYLVHSTDKGVRHWATSGGVINSFVRYLLEYDYVDGVILTMRCDCSPIEAFGTLLTKDSIDLLVKNPRDFTSRYVTVPLLATFSGLENKKRYAVVGTPCQLKALDNITSIKKYNLIKIGVTCSGGTRYVATKEYKRKKSAKNCIMYYRGDGWPGKNVLINGKSKIEYPHRDSLFERMFSSQIFKNPGCRKCHDHFAENADISFCDFWNSNEIREEAEGNSCVIVRNKISMVLFEGMINNGYAEVKRTLTKDEVIKTQLHILKLKKGNASSKLSYKMYIHVADYIYKFGIYKWFGIDIYRLLCKVYAKILVSSQLPDENIYN